MSSRRMGAGKRFLVLFDKIYVKMGLWISFRKAVERIGQMEFYGTLGPACCDESTLAKLFRAGMTGVRLNLSHGGLADCGQWLGALDSAAKQAGAAPRLLIDLQGPELRIGDLEPVELVQGAPVRLGAGGIPTPALLFPALLPGGTLLLDDGAILLRVVTPGPDYADCRVERAGILRPRKSIAAPGTALHPPTLTGSDLENLSLASKCGVTGVMLPFVREPEDLLCLRAALERAGAPRITILAKLENRAGVDMLPALLPHADEIVIARGDLGNDVPLWELPALQKRAAAICRTAGKPFMVVTQLLHSMHRSAVPTRAEVSDIFNAVLDGASSLMLTGETAVGAYPVEAMDYLRRTAEEALRYRNMPE